MLKAEVAAQTGAWRCERSSDLGARDAELYTAGRGERALLARTEWQKFHQAGDCDLKGNHSASFKKVNMIRLFCRSSETLV